MLRLTRLAEIPDDLDCLLITFRNIAGMSAFELGLSQAKSVVETRWEAAIRDKKDVAVSRGLGWKRLVIMSTTYAIDFGDLGQVE